MLTVLLFFPILSGFILFLAKSRIVNKISLVLNSILYLGFSILYYFEFTHNWQFAGLSYLGGYFEIDSIGFYFFFILSLVYSSTAFYSLAYFKNHNFTIKDEILYTAGILLFLAAMSGVILSNNLGLLWVFVEATTLTSAILIYIEKKKSSLEAAWKYIFICSIGIALAFIGIICFTIGSQSVESLFFHDLYEAAKSLNPFWLKIAFAFILVGFGTKVGIAPMHAWLPDAHSEAPSPASAMLSGTLLNTALLGILRVNQIMVKAGLGDFTQKLFLITGMLSLLVSAMYIMRVHNYKRMLAYSSIENMGIIFIGFGTGAIFAALLHTVAHSLAKSSLFLTSGNILHVYKTKEIKGVKGLLKSNIITGWIWIVSFLAISGLPPFPAFISKFLIVKSLFGAGLEWFSIPIFFLLVMIVYGMGKSVFSMSFDDELKKDSIVNNEKLGFYTYVPQIILLLILLLIGFYIPDRLMQIMQNSVNYF